MKNFISFIGIIVTFLLLSSFDAKAQRLTISSEVGYFDNDKNISSISQVWSDYISAIDTSSDTSHFWNSKSLDIHTSLHKDGLLNTYNIRKLTDNIYEINTIAYYPDSAIKGGLMNAIYKVCAVQVDDKWLLTNYFDAVKERYISHNTDNINFYIGNGVSFDRKKIKYSAKFIQTFIDCYNIESSNKVIYVAGGSIDECSAMIGLIYTPIRSHKPYAGRTINNIVLSTRLDHIHEVVHAIMLPLFPNAPLFLHEGIATYYGGTAELNFKTLKKEATTFIERESIDFNNNDFLKAQLSDSIPLSYIVAAAVVEYALQKGGESEVLRLFKSKSYDEIFDLLGISYSQRGDFIRNLFIK